MFIPALIELDEDNAGEDGDGGKAPERCGDDASGARLGFREVGIADCGYEEGGGAEEEERGSECGEVWYYLEGGKVRWGK